MKQRLLLVLLALFTSIGWMKATVTLTVPKGATGSLSISQASGTGNTPVTVKFGSEVVKSYSVNNYTKDGDLTVTIEGSLTSLNVNTKVTSVKLESAYQLTSLVFSSTAGSTIQSFSFTNTNNLQKLTADNCGLTQLPTDYQNNIAEGATLSFKNNKITNVSGLDINKKYSIDLSGNNITVWPESLANNKATITFGDQGEFDEATPQQANAWYDIYKTVNAKFGGYSASDWTFSWKKKEASGSLTTINLEKNTANPGQYRFYDTSSKKYVSGTFQATATLSKSSPKVNLTYTVNVTVTKAQLGLKQETSGKGTFTVKKATENGAVVADNGNVSEGDRLFLSAKPDAGWTFKEYELEGLVKTSDENIYEVKILRDGQYDKLSAKAIFTKNSQKITIDANSEHGDIVIKNQNDKEIQNGTSVAYGSTLTITATPEEGYKARVIVNGSELTSTTTNNNEFTIKITKDTKIQIFFEKAKQYKLRVDVLAYYDKAIINGEDYSYSKDDGTAQYYNNNGSVPQFAPGTLITLEMHADGQKKEAAITKVLLNSKQIGTTNKVQFEMPANDATITFETAQLSEISINAESAQTYTYDGSAHPFVFKTVPSGLESSIEVTYSAQGLGNFISEVPTVPGNYDVKIYRKADALYKEIDDDTKYDIVINKATPVVKTVPTVKVNDKTKEYEITGGSVQVAGKNVEGTWKVTEADGVSVSDNKCTKTESHLVTITFSPKNDSYYNVVPANTQAKVGDKSLEQYTITYDLPDGMTLKMTNGGEELTSGDKVYAGTKVTFELTYAKGFENVKLIKNEGTGIILNPTSTEGNTQKYSETIKADLALKVIFDGNVSKTDIILEIIDIDGRPIKSEYDGEVHNFSANNFKFTSPSAGDDIEAVKAKMVITYKLNGKQVTSPVDAGEYTVHVSIPEVVGEETTYNALEKDFEKGLIIEPKDISNTITWPKDAVVGVGKTAKTAQFIGGFAGVEGTFHFVEEDKIGVPETGDEYEVKFVPADATNYKEVLSTNKAKIVVTDQRTLFISSVSNGSIKVTDQNGNELKNGQTLNSGITAIKVTATPNSGYALGSLTVNNYSLSNGGSYTLGSDNVVVNATFVKQYTITLGSAPKGVKIATKPSSDAVIAGGSYTFTLNHLSGDKPTVTGASNISVSTSGSTTTVKVTNIQANATLAIALANPTAIKITTKPTLSKAGKPMGTIRVSGVNSSNECYYGDKITVTATANPGVEFAGWEGLTSTENPYEFEATNASYTIQAKYHGTLTGIESVDELKYYGGDGYIFVNCPAQGTLTIISMNGRAQKMSVSGQTRVTVPAGVYGIVLTSGSEVVRDKVVVR